MPDTIAEDRTGPRRRLLVALVAAGTLAAGLGLVSASKAVAGDRSAGRGERNVQDPSGGHDCDRRERTSEVSV
jgi:hypothetical protein